MKVGGNESATKYFQSHGGAAALASKDAKVRYISPAAGKYKDELKRRAAVDAKEYAGRSRCCIYSNVRTDLLKKL